MKNPEVRRVYHVNPVTIEETLHEILDDVLRLNTDCVIELKKAHRNRTLSQNKYLWGIVYWRIAQEIGEDEETVHELMKYKFLKTHTEVKGETFVSTLSTTQLSVEQFTRYIEQIKLWAWHFLNVSIEDQ